MKKQFQKTFLAALFMLFASGVSAHGVQVGYCQLSNGFIRIFIEHWHGDQTIASLVNNGMSITTTYGSTTVTQNLNPTGSINNTAWNQLSGCGSGITILSKCASLANTYNDWAYYDFAPAVCGQAIKITLNSGNTVVLEEACAELYPVSVTATFYDVSPPTLTCSNVLVTSCNPIAVNFAITAQDDCDPNPSVSYSIASGSTFNVGSTEVTATATDNKNQTSTCKFNVIVSPPALNISATSNMPCEGETLNLYATTVTNATYAWTGPGSFTSTNQNPTISNAQSSDAGTYNVTITVSSSCVYTASVKASVNPKPTINAGNDVTYCATPAQLNATVTDNTPAVSGSLNVLVYDANGGNGNFTGNLCNDGYVAISSGVTSPSFSITGATNITSIQFKAYWTCGNGDWTVKLNGVTIGTSGTLANSYCQCIAPSNTYPGTFTITGSQINTNWNVNGSNTLTVVPNNPGINAVAGFSAVVNYDNSPTYSWSPSTGLSSTSIANPVADPENPTTYTVTYTTAAGCTATDDVTVTKQCCIEPAITCPSNITVDNTTGECGANVTFEATATGTSPTITYSPASGSFFAVGTTTVTATATNSCGTDQCTFDVIVTDVEKPTAICQNVTVTLSGGTGSITASQVDNGSNDACGIKSITVSPSTFNCSNIGANTVTLTVTDNNDNVSTCDATVTVAGAIPTCSIAVTPSNNTNTGGIATNIYLGYGPQSATMTANAAGGSGFTYSWSPSTYLSSSTSQSPVFTPTAEGNYTYTVTVTNSNGCVTTCSKSFCVKDVQVSGTSGKKVYLCHLPPGNNQNPQTLSISTSAVSSHIGNHSGDALGSCGATCYSNKRTIVDELVVDIDNLEITCSPNPFNQSFKLNYISAFSTEATISVYGITGNLIERTTVSGNSNNVELGKNLPAGIYNVSFVQGDIIKIFKMIKVN